MRGVQLIQLERHTDSRGSLVAFARDLQMPFDVRNVYFILDCPSDAVRAEHASTNHSAIIALTSAVTVDLDNGSEQESQRLASPDTALIIRGGVWMRLREFSQETTLVVLSSRPFGEMKHLERPEPTLLDNEP